MSKLTSMALAVAQYVPDGSSVAIGLALEHLIPFAAGHEIIRQQRRNLTLIGPISDILFDQLIGAGCVEKVKAAWVGNVSEGLAHCYRPISQLGWLCWQPVWARPTFLHAHYWAAISRVRTLRSASKNRRWTALHCCSCLL